jgi:hypothetical protein
VVGVAYLARINGLLLAFNIVPALPLDGGRILHVLLWHRTGDKTWATMAAARPGRAFGLLLIAIGLLSMLTGSGIGAIWFVFLGWFLVQAVVNQEISSAQLEQAVTGLRVRDLMAPDFVSGDTPDEHRRVSRTVARSSPLGALLRYVGLRVGIDASSDVGQDVLDKHRWVNSSSAATDYRVPATASASMAATTTGASSSGGPHPRPLATTRVSRTRRN